LGHRSAFDQQAEIGEVPIIENFVGLDLVSRVADRAPSGRIAQWQSSARWQVLSPRRPGGRILPNHRETV
jgi:hypothetical protein